MERCMVLSMWYYRKPLLSRVPDRFVKLTKKNCIPLNISHDLFSIVKYTTYNLKNCSLYDIQVDRVNTQEIKAHGIIQVIKVCFSLLVVHSHLHECR